MRDTRCSVNLLTGLGRCNKKNRGCHVDARVFTTHTAQKHTHLFIQQIFTESTCDVVGTKLYMEIQAWHWELRVYCGNTPMNNNENPDGGRRTRMSENTEERARKLWGFGNRFIEEGETSLMEFTFYYEPVFIV